MSTTKDLKRIVKGNFPKAKAEKHKTNDGKTYWLIRDGLYTMYIADGKTEKEAWRNTLNKLIKSSIACTSRPLKKMIFTKSGSIVKIVNVPSNSHLCTIKRIDTGKEMLASLSTLIFEEENI